MIGLTERQRECLALIEDHVAEHGYPPTVTEIAAGMDIASGTSGADKHVKALVQKGYISQTHQGRTIRVLRPTRPVLPAEVEYYAVRRDPATNLDIADRRIL